MVRRLQMAQCTGLFCALVLLITSQTLNEIQAGEHEEIGLASFYFHGEKTASGEPFGSFLVYLIADVGQRAQIIGRQLKDHATAETREATEACSRSGVRTLSIAIMMRTQVNYPDASNTSPRVTAIKETAPGLRWGRLCYSVSETYF